MRRRHRRQNRQDDREQTLRGSEEFPDRPRLCTAKTRRFMPLQLRRENQPVDAEALEKPDAFDRAQHKSGGRKRICQQRIGRDDRDAGHGICRRAASRIENVVPPRS